MVFSSLCIFAVCRSTPFPWFCLPSVERIISAQQKCFQAACVNHEITDFYLTALRLIQNAIDAKQDVAELADSVRSLLHTYVPDGWYEEAESPKDEAGSPKDTP